MKKLLIFALAAMSMVACVKEEVTLLPQGDAISFENAFIDNATRTAVDPSTTTATLNGFNVWGFVKEYDGVIFDGVEVTKNGDVWSYMGTQYWVPNQPYYFAALAPVENASWNVVSKATGEAAKQGLGLIAFTNDNGTEDLLYAKEKMTSKGLNEPNGAVKFQFKHLLSKVKFTFKNGFPTETTTIKVTNVEMKVPASAEINLAQADYSKAWTNHAATTTTLEFGDVETLAYTQSAEAACERLTIPAVDSFGYNITFNIELFMGAQSVYTVTKTSKVTGVELEMGKAYNFTAEINPENLELEEIVFDVTAVEGWTEPTENVDVDYFYDTDSKTYSVATAKGLQEVAEKINAGEFTANITLLNDIVLPTTRSAVGNWTPLGLTTKNSYRGTFNGNGHTIENLVCTDSDVAGLIGYTYNATIKNVTLKDATISSNHYAGGIVAWVNNLPGNTKVPFVLENCHVLNSTITSTPELVDGVYDNGDKAGGLIGAVWFTNNGVRNPGAQVANCSVKNTTIKAYRDLGGLFGLAQGVYAENCVLENVTVKQDLTNAYQSEVPTTVGDVIGRDSGYNEIDISWR